MYRRLRVITVPLLLACLGSLADKPIFVNGIAAEVSGKPITVEDVYLHRMLEKVKKPGETGSILGIDPGKESAESLKASVQELVFEEMVFAEMKSLNFEGGPKSEAQRLLVNRKKVAAFRTEWEKALQYFRITEEKAQALLWRSIQVERFVEKKVETLTPVVTPDVVDRQLVANTPNWTSLSEVKKAELRSRTERLIRKERASAQLREWVVRLKRTYGVVQYL